VLSGHSQRRELLKQAWRDVARVFIASIILDLIYQISVLRWIYPVQAAFVASVLALLPYLLVRGPTNRLAKLWRSRHGKRAPTSPNLAVRK
jgi:lauroyl/myristoyl acyltransferase